jgi:hypothetical protein
VEYHFVQGQPSTRLTRYPLAELLLVDAFLAEVLLADGRLVEPLQLKLHQPPLDLGRRPRFRPPLGPIQELQTRLVSSLQLRSLRSICD